VEDDDDEVERTDVWDEEALRKAGLGHLVDEAPKAATSADGPKGPSIVVSDDLSQPAIPAAKAAPSAGTSQRIHAQPTPPSRVGLSWPLTIALAIVLGAAVYTLIIFLR
jgi:hypothetical protein